MKCYTDKYERKYEKMAINIKLRGSSIINYSYSFALKGPQCSFMSWKAANIYEVDA